MTKITIKDVAREAGVSIATVSNALNGSDVVLPKTREHVVEVARRLNYIPNANGRQLRASQTYNIGLFVPSMTGSYYGDMADSIHYLCQKHGYELQIYIVDEGKSLLTRLQNQSIDGAIIMFGGLSSTDKKQLLRNSIPLVFVDQEVAGRKTSSVIYESFEHGRMAAQYLLGLGHRDLMHIFGVANNYDSIQRLAGFEAALKEAGVPLRKENILSGRFERAAAYRSMHRYLQEGYALPDAVFAANDLSALGCIEALKEYSIRVPEDISVIGCDDNLLSRYVTPGLTTIRTHMEELGVEAAKEVFRLITEKEGRIVRLPGDIIVRHSCAFHSENGRKDLKR
ncbi:MAG: LacI family DNA-binding transcriptional regulator [Clostridia bacterium]|nr:LacI family DNA-binding transcriptional regulator [Clostridia bacterium]MBQ6233073.1 LacI family DNA-binding transcriptional regulator [Clostridia bacterium]